MLRLVARDLVLPNGRRTKFHIVEHPGAVAILPVHANGDVVLLQQFRPSIGQEIYEIPAGTIEKGEAPLATAKREIIEETGFKAKKWSKIGEFYTAPGLWTGPMPVFLANGLTPRKWPGTADSTTEPGRVTI